MLCIHSRVSALSTNAPTQGLTQEMFIERGSAASSTEIDRIIVICGSFPCSVRSHLHVFVDYSC